ncbi:dTMP kinase [Teichococcus oryzae]|uniref:Thymidylate kinase n=1 Tax=Teichococcus oryzae TaxID=1608942 RepID=A0A5B2TL01_9PROT|nr:dTMP kinase [Pseudoroseomonas oryzae]KAA2215187.1 dTMP kinase [Pseudoroseomonas oryzae]
MTRGCFITLEGGEGAGKTTLARGLARHLAGHGHAVLRTREPGGAPGAEALRALLLTPGLDWDPVAEAMLMFASRREHWIKTIHPALEAGAWVICDRFFDSTLAYQCAGRGLDQGIWRALRDLSLPGIAPDATLILDVDPGLGMARAMRRSGPDRFEQLDGTFHRRVRDAFLEIARREPGRCVVLDAARAEQDILSDALLALRRTLGAPP